MMRMRFVAVGQVAVMHVEPRMDVLRLRVDVIDTLGVERGGPAFESVDHVAFGEQESREVGTVLAGDPVISAVFIRFL